MATTNDIVINPGAGIDPNTMQPQAAAPLTNAANALNDNETYVDEWAKSPTGDAPVRTWVDPTAREGADGEFLSAWYDSPVQPQANPSGLPSHNVAAVAPDPVVAPPAAPVAAAAPAVPMGGSGYSPFQGYFENAGPGSGATSGGGVGDATGDGASGGVGGGPGAGAAGDGSGGGGGDGGVGGPGGVGGW